MQGVFPETPGFSPVKFVLLLSCYYFIGDASAIGTGTFFSPFNSAAVCWMLRVEKPLKKPQVPYFSCNCGSTAWSPHKRADPLASCARRERGHVSRRAGLNNGL